MSRILLVLAILGGSLSTNSSSCEEGQSSSLVLADECELLQVSSRFEERKPVAVGQPAVAKRTREPSQGNNSSAEAAAGNSVTAAERNSTAKSLAVGKLHSAAERNSTGKLLAFDKLDSAAERNSTGKLLVFDKLDSAAERNSKAKLLVQTTKKQRGSKQAPDEAPSETNLTQETAEDFKSSDIWNSSIEWITIKTYHPAGVISNVHGGKVEWADVSYVNLNVLIVISLVAYPALFLAILYALVITVALALGQRSQLNTERSKCRCYLPGIDDEDVFWSEDGIQRQTSNASHEEGKVQERRRSDSSQDVTPRAENGVLFFTGRSPGAQTLPFGPDYAPPMLARDDLNAFSQMLYSGWAYFCCTIPSLMVFGLPLVLMTLTISFPQEVFSILSILVAALVFSNGVYMTIFASSASLRMYQAVHNGGDSRRSGGAAVVPSVPRALQWLWPEEEPEEGIPCGPSESALKSVHHWVLLPQYQEDAECVAMALKSISENTYAKTNIGVLLAMEEREAGVQAKAEKLRAEHLHLFEEVCISYHPANLPNDPPGKASNLKWAADCLLEHLWKTRTDLARIIVTVADADSEFHNKYFDTLSAHYLEAPPDIRNLRIWQSPIFHLKNYFRQPSPVIVGTMFTTMQEMSIIADPNGIRFPYSTYSLSLELVRRVGGWDAEWIAEDWHMGIKCYLLTVGLVCVEPIMLPTLNYTPEDTTWYKSCCARWAQAKRHALGFSDLSYYFMMLPLIFAHALSKANTGTKTRIKHLRAFWGMATHGVTMLIRLVNVHVVIGVMANYGLLNLILRAWMFFFMSPDRHIDMLWKRTDFCVTSLMASSMFFMVMVTFQFQFVFRITRHRMDELPDTAGPWSRWLFKKDFFHWAYTAFCFLAYGPFYFFFLGIAAWRAAIKMIISPVFEYEVAAKPKPLNPSKLIKRDDNI